MTIANLRLLKMEFSETAFAKENGSHTWTDIRAINPAVTLERQVHRRAYNLQYLTQHPGNVLGRRSAKLGFGVELCGTGTALTSGTASTTDGLNNLMKLCLGGDNTGYRSGSVVGSTSTSTTIAVSTIGAYPDVGIVMLSATGTGSVNEIRPYSARTAVSTSGTLTLAVAATSGAASGTTVWGGHMCHQDVTATATGQAQVIASDTADQWLLMGLHGGLTFSNLLGLNGIPTVDFDFNAIDWELETAATLGGASFAGAAPLATSEEIEVHWGDYGSTTTTKIACSDLTINPNLVWTPHMCRGAGDTQHADRVNMTSGAASGSGITGSFTVDAATAYYTDFSAQTEKQLLITCGRTPGSSWAIWIRRCLVTSQVTPTAHMDQCAVQVNFEAMGITSTAALNRSPIIFARL